MKRTASISLGVSILVGIGAIVGLYGGWRLHVSQEVIHTERVDALLSTNPQTIERIGELEKGRMINASNIEKLVAGQQVLSGQVSQLVESQARTNEQLARLSEHLMEYLARHSRGSP